MMFKKILLPTDGSVLGNIAASHGIAMAAKLGAEVVGVNITREYKPELSLGSNPISKEIEAAVKAEGIKILCPTKERAEQAGVKFTGIVRAANHPAQAIVRVARELECDMIFIGSHGCAGWDSILLGSVSNKVLATARIPVLVYRLQKQEVPVGISHSYATVTTS